MPRVYKSLANGRWFKFSLNEQMANIGADVGRAVKWKLRGEKRSAQAAFERAIELFDLTLDDPKHKGRYKEIARAREVFCDYMVGDNEYHSTPESFNKYFYPFNYAARKRVMHE